MRMRPRTTGNQPRRVLEFLRAILWWWAEQIETATAAAKPALCLRGQRRGAAEHTEEDNRVPFDHAFSPDVSASKPYAHWSPLR